MSKAKCRLAVLISGAGSTMVNLAKHIEAGKLPAEIAVVVSSRKNVLGLDRAAGMGIPTETLTRRGFKQEGVFNPTAYSQALADLLDGYRPDLIVMAGFMTRLEAPVLSRWDVINVHPALLPMFGGENFHGHKVHEAVLEAGVKITGATVHFADAIYDGGAIILQQAVAVQDDDTPDTLAARVQAAEREIYPHAIRLIAEGRLERSGRVVRIKKS